MTTLITKTDDQVPSALLATSITADKIEDKDEKETKKMRGRKPKVKAPTKVERQDILRQRILKLKDDLEAAGFGGSLKMPTRPLETDS